MPLLQLTILNMHIRTGYLYGFLVFYIDTNISEMDNSDLFKKYQALLAFSSSEES